jgi:hypothetical protein
MLALQNITSQAFLCTQTLSWCCQNFYLGKVAQMELNEAMLQAYMEGEFVRFHCQFVIDYDVAMQ